MNTSLFIARRVSLRRENKGLSTGVIIAVAGVALSLAVMIVAIAVMTGFKQQIRSRILAFQAPLSISAIASSTDIHTPVVEFNSTLSTEIHKALGPGVTINPVAIAPAILKSDSQFAGLMIKGIPASDQIPLINQSITHGSMPDFEADSTLYHIIISDALASTLGIEAGEKVDAFFTDGSTPRRRKLKIAATFDTHFTDYDKSLAFANISMLRQIAHADSTYATSVEISAPFTDEEIDQAASTLSASLINAHYSGELNQFYTVANVHDTAAIYFNWLELLDTNVTVILIIMLLVSSLTLISSLYIIVLERVNMIGILKALGADNALIRKVFMLITMRLAGAGIIIGNIIALSLIYIQKATSFISLDAESYYLDAVPVDLKAWWLIAINAGVILVSLLVLVVPSRIVASISPSEAIKYE